MAHQLACLGGHAGPITGSPAAAMAPSTLARCERAWKRYVHHVHSSGTQHAVMQVGGFVGWARGTPSCEYVGGWVGEAACGHAGGSVSWQVGCSVVSCQLVGQLPQVPQGLGYDSRLKHPVASRVPHSPSVPSPSSAHRRLSVWATTAAWSIRWPGACSAWTSGCVTPAGPGWRSRWTGRFTTAGETAGSFMMPLGSRQRLRWMDRSPTAGVWEL